jgi:hypothetical protein
MVSMMIPKFPRAWARRSLPAYLAVALAGSRNPESVDPRTCVQTYEFGNTGCFVVTGQVVGANGQALSAARIFSRLSPDIESSVFAFVIDVPDSSGRFRVLARRMAGLPAPGQDTVGVVVGAFWPPTLRRDSVFVTATLAPVGQIPNPVDVRIILPVP